jgi:acetyltransferase-like isoleucine patch superfamily enzyme
VTGAQTKVVSSSAITLRRLPDVTRDPGHILRELTRRVRYVAANGSSVARSRWYLRTADNLGWTVRVTGRPVVSNLGRLVIGDRVQLVSTITKIELATGPQGVLEIGERTFVNYGTSVSSFQSVLVGARCQIGTYCLVLDNNFHRPEPERRNERPESRPVTIGDDVWLGSRVIVLPGSTIGDGSVIGAGSVVASDIPPRTLAAGVPAKVIRSL